MRNNDTRRCSIKRCLLLGLLRNLLRYLLNCLWRREPLPSGLRRQIASGAEMAPGAARALILRCESRGAQLRVRLTPEE